MSVTNWRSSATICNCFPRALAPPCTCSTLQALISSFKEAQLLHIIKEETVSLLHLNDSLFCCAVCYAQDVKLSAAYSIIQLLRTYAPDTPYGDEELRVNFGLYY